MPDYSKTSIYKICCKDATITDIYIGSTCNFTRRKAVHKYDCNKEISKRYNQYKYQFIRDNGGWDNWTMIQLKEFSCNNKKEKDTEERKHIDELKPSLNKSLPTRTNKEYYLTHKEEKKQYQLKNKEKIKEQSRQNYLKNKDKNKEQRKDYMKQYYLNNKEQRKEKDKQYRINNKEKDKEYQKEYRINNKEKIKEKKKQYYLKNKNKNKEKIKEYKKQYYLKKKAEKTKNDSQ